MIPEVGSIFRLKTDSSIFIMRDDDSSIRKVSPQVFMRSEGFWMNLMPRGEAAFWRSLKQKGFEYLSSERLTQRATDEHWLYNLKNLLKEDSHE